MIQFVAGAVLGAAVVASGIYLRLVWLTKNMLG